MASDDEAWILGGTGRTGRAIVEGLAFAGVPVPLVGRDAARLDRATARANGRVRTAVARSVEATAAEIRRRPAVVVRSSP